MTLRPRSKLERLLDALSDEYEVPDRPALDLLSQLTLLQLVGAGADGKAALGAMTSLCAKDGSIDPAKLAQVPRELVGSVCRGEHTDETVGSLRAAGEVAAASTESLDERCQEDLADARRLLRTVPGITEQRADLLLLYAGVHAVIAPTALGVQVAARLGYPGTSYGSFARALDAELPAPDAVDIAWRAHHLLEQHGKKVCTPRDPTCGRCRIRAACAFHGEGDDPAAKLSVRPPA